MPHPRAEVSDKLPTTGTDKMTNAGGGVGMLGIDWAVSIEIMCSLVIIARSWRWES